MVLAVVALLAIAPSAQAETKRISYRAMDDQSERVFFKGGGLRLVGDCDPDDELSVFARSKYDDAMIHVNSQSTGPDDDYGEEDDFDHGAANQVDLLDGLLGVDDSTSGQIVYARPGGKAVTIDWLAEEADAYGGARDCLFAGTARIVDSSSSGRVNFRAPAGTPETAIFDGGIAIFAECTPAGDLQVEATTGISGGDVFVNGAALHYNSQSAGDVDFSDGDEDIEILDRVDVLAGGDDSSSGQIVYSRPGRFPGTMDGPPGPVTVNWAAEDDNNGDGAAPFGGAKDCAFVGTVRDRGIGDPRWLAFSDDAVTPLTTILNQGGLKLQAECQSGGEPNVLVSSTSDHAVIHQNGHNGDPAAFYDQRNNFNADPDDRFDLFDGFGVDEDGGVGQIIYSNFVTGTNVTVDWWSAEDAFLPSRECVFLGTAEVAPK